MNIKREEIQNNICIFITPKESIGKERYIRNNIREIR